MSRSSSDFLEGGGGFFGNSKPAWFETDLESRCSLKSMALK